MTITKGASPTDLSPDPAFDRLLGTLQQMTTAPIMLPATLPPQLEKVAITGTRGDTYTILFLTPNAPDDLIQSNIHAYVHGWLTAQPASTPLNDPRRSNYTVTQLGTVTLPNGTIANVTRLDPPEGANYGTQIEGTFEEGSERYTIHIESIDTPDGDLVRKMLSTMVKVPKKE